MSTGSFGKDAKTFKYLEFTIGSNIRTGKTTNNIRVPVPPEKEMEAAAIVNVFSVK
jgi:hypothetical protein